MEALLELSGNDMVAMIYQTESGFTVAKRSGDQTLGIFRYRTQDAAIKCALQIIKLEL
jgi:hypothetical protein